MGKAHSPNFLQERCGLTQPAPEVPFLPKRKEPKIRQRGSFLFGITSKGKTAPLLPALSCFFACGPENGQSPFSELFCRKVTPLGNFAKRSSLPLSAPIISKCQILHLLLRAVSGHVVAVAFLEDRVSKGATPLSLEVKEPGGSLCALCETFFTQESFRGCGLRKPAIFLQRVWRRSAAPSHACAYKRNGFTECTSAGLGTTLQQIKSFGEGNFVSFSYPHHQCNFAKSPSASMGCVSPQKSLAGTTLRNRVVELHAPHKRSCRNLPAII